MFVESNNMIKSFISLRLVFFEYCQKITKAIKEKLFIFVFIIY